MRTASPYDVVGAAEGADLTSLNPDAQSFILRALAQHLDRITQVVLTNSQAPVEQVEYEVDNSNLTAGGQNYKLPSGQAIVSYYVENNSGATLNVFAGSSGAGRSINTVPAYGWKVALMPQQLTSMSIMSTALAATGLVRILVTSTPLGPAMGSIVGAAMSPPSTTATLYVTALGAAGAVSQILAANPNRIGAIITNPSTGTATYGYGTAPSGSSYAGVIAANSTVPNLPVNYRGPIFAFPSATGQQVNVTEFTL